MPLPIWLSHRLAQRLAQVRRVGVLPYLRPDGKTQVSVIYEDGRPVSIDTILISTQHQPGIDLETLLLPDLREHVIHPLLPTDLDTSSLRILAQPHRPVRAGRPPRRTRASPVARSSSTTYGGMARHGGGRLLRQGPSKVDRSAAYAARWVAKHVVASGAASRCEVQVAYAIGVARPVSVLVETSGPRRSPPSASPAWWPSCSTCGRGHHPGPRPAPSHLPAHGGLRPFGRSDKDFTWEATPRVDDLRRALGSEPGRRCVGSKCGGAARA